MNVTPKNNLHNHPINGSLSHKIPKKVSSDLGKTIKDNPYLTTRQIASGQGLGYRPGSADIAGNSYGRLDYHRKKTLKECGLNSKGIHMVSEMEKIADKIDLKDSQIEGSTMISKRYSEIGRPYMRDYNISPTFMYQFIMSPLMSKLLSEAEFLETDTTYNENSELMYLFNATVFNYDTMKWAVVARMRGNKEDSGFYKKAFELVFHTCQSYHSNFKVGESLKGIIIDWSDTEAKGLRELLGDNVADKVLKGCNVHWTRSYQRVADKVNNNVHRSNRVLAKEAFCAVAKQVMLAKTKEDVLKLFDVLQGKAEILTVQHLLSLPDEHLTVVTHNCDWLIAKTWVQWWIRPKHLQMLSKPFSVMSSSHWDQAPRNTNGVERANGLAKSGTSKISLFAAMQSLYEKDKMFALQYLAASEISSKISYRSAQEDERRGQSSLQNKQKQKNTDASANFGPPDKNEHFQPPQSKKIKKSGNIVQEGKNVEVLYSDGLWYKGWLSSFNFETGKWVVMFYDDDKTTEVSFPDKEVRLCQ